MANGATERVFDAYLVAAARDGDRSAFEQLAQRWQRKLIAHAWRLTGDADAAADAVQHGWAEIAAHIARLRDERAFAAWAYRIVSRAVAQQVKRAVRRRAVATELAAVPNEATEAGSMEPDLIKLRAAMVALPPEQRSAVALFHLEEMSVAEVAVALDIPAGTVKTRLMHARRKLRAALEGE